jgi:hypothetical protein
LSQVLRGWYAWKLLLPVFHTGQSPLFSLRSVAKTKYDCQSRCFDISCYQLKKFMKFYF